MCFNGNSWFHCKQLDNLLNYGDLVVFIALNLTISLRIVYERFRFPRQAIIVYMVREGSVHDFVHLTFPFLGGFGGGIDPTGDVSAPLLVVSGGAEDWRAGWRDPLGHIRHWAHNCGRANVATMYIAMMLA